MFYNTVTGKIEQLPKERPQPQLLAGYSAPPPELGNIGDSFINSISLDLYGPKTANGWGEPKEIKGNPGKDGLDGLPGKDGEVGPQGTQGPPGEKGEPGQRGEQGPEGLQGLPGLAGLNGGDGKDGREVELGRNQTHIQWRYVGEKFWKDLLAIPAGKRGSGGGAHKLQQLMDVLIDDAQNNDTLTYNNGKWVNTATPANVASINGLNGAVSLAGGTSIDVATNTGTGTITVSLSSGTLNNNISGNAATATTATTATTAISATTATNITTANEATDATCFLTFVTDSGTQSSIAAKTNTGLAYNSNTNNLAATTFTGALVGNAATATTAAKWTTPRALAGNSTDGSADVPFANKFIVQGTTDSGLSGAQFLGSLATGIVKNTTSTGVLSIATAATDYVAPSAYASANGLTMSTAKLLGRTTASTGAAEEITIGSGLTLSAGTLTATGSGGTVTSVSVVSANGFAGTVATATTTPAITITTSITGIIKGNGTAISAATSGTDYSAGTSGLATGILKSTATTGVLSIAGVATDYVAPSAYASGNGLTMTTGKLLGRTSAGTGAAQEIATGSNLSFAAASLDVVATPHFLRVGDSTLGTDNQLLGDNAGPNITSGSTNIIIGDAAASITTGGGNIVIGAGSFSTASSPLTAGDGRNIGIGLGTFLYLGGNAKDNLAVGQYSGFNKTGGNANMYLGPFTQGSTATVSNEIVISTNGTSGNLVSGKGANTCLVDAQAGLYSYSPAYCHLRSTAFNNGIVTWQFFNDGTLYNNGFQLLLSNTQVAPPFPGLYEVTVSGSAQAQASLFVAIDLNTINGLGFRNIAYQSSSGINTFIVNVSGTQLSRPYVTSNPALSGWQVNCNGGKFYSIDFPLFMTIKFVSL